MEFLTAFWLKLLDMSQSDIVLFSFGTFGITERYVIWVILAAVAILVLIIIRLVAKWLVGGVARTMPTQKPPVVKTETAVQTVTTPAQPVASTAINNELVDADRKRTLYDYVTPDSIHAEVMKQTLNNDYPYQTMKPDPTKISSTTPIPTSPITVPSVAPMPATVMSPLATQLPPLPERTVADIESASIQKTAQMPVMGGMPTTAPVMPNPAPIVPPVTLPPVQPTMTPLPVQAVTPTTVVTVTTTLPPLPPLPNMPQQPMPTTPTVLPPLPVVTPQPIAANTVLTPIPVAQSVQMTSPITMMGPAVSQPPMQPAMTVPTMMPIVSTQPAVSMPVTPTTIPFGPTDPLLP